MACEASKRFGNIQKFRISRQKTLTQGYSPAGFYTFSNNRRHTFEFRRLFEEECPSEENVRCLIRIYTGAWLPSKPSRVQFIKITRPHKFKAFATETSEKTIITLPYRALLTIHFFSRSA